MKNNILPGCVFSLLTICFMVLICGIANAQSIKWSLKTEEKKGTGWTCSYSYPVLSAPEALMGVAGDFNKQISKSKDQEIKSFIDEMKNSKIPPVSKDLLNEHTVKCSIIGENQKYGSFLFEHYEMVSGMAHPNSWYSTITWSMNGKFLIIEDILSDKSALSKLSNESEKLIKEKLHEYEKELQPEGWAPKAENFQNFCISADGLRIYFNTYQLGPRPLGAPDILIPWKSLKENLSPLARKLLD